MILLIRPNLKENMNLGVPIGLLYVSAALKNKGFKTKIVDYIVDDIDIVKLIKKYKPEAIGFSVTYNLQKENTFEIVRQIKLADNNMLLVAGGNAASIMSDEFIINGFDVVVRGEGEQAFVEIMKGKKFYDIDGITYKHNGVIKSTADRKFIPCLDTLPFPDYESIDMKKYMNPESRIDFFNDSPKERISIITSRGCPMGCYFCSIHLQMGKQWRANSVEYVIKHLELLTKKYGIKHVSFEDDNLTLDPKRFEDILDRMKNEKIDITWDTPNGVRVDTLNRKLLIKMKETGLTRLTIGIESGSQKFLDDVIHKNIRLINVLEVARICKEEKISLSAFYIIGMPGETKKQIEMTLNLAMTLLKKYDVIPKVSVCAAMPGTELTKICELKDYLKRGRIETPEFTAEDIDKYYNDFGKKCIVPYIKRMNYKTLAGNLSKMPKTAGRFFFSKKAQKV
jgi:anaerobic magnesium-protoporphyrin IX monomethyl ester cyclase